MIDASGDNFTDAIVTTSAPTESQVEAWVAGYQAITQASVWKVTQSLAWVGDSDPQNADTAQRSSVGDGINLLYKDLTNLKTATPRVVAPTEAIMQGDQDIPLLSVQAFVDYLTALGAILSDYSLQSAQYTERRERRNNPRIKV